MFIRSEKFISEREKSFEITFRSNGTHQGVGRGARGLKINIADFGAENTGKIIATQAIQQAIDAAEEKDTVYIPRGIYLVGSLFLKSQLNFEIAEGAELIGSKKLSDYKMIDSRIAGIEMVWPGAIINAIDCKEVHILGKGKINGQGSIWWRKFWGTDKQGGMLEKYRKQNLRWAADYDCQRPRNICFYGCTDCTMEDIHSIDSGFWNIQLTYSKRMTLRNLIIKNGNGPSTDGIDIDSCQNVLVEKCFVECNDDNIVVKAGRGIEAYQKASICRNVLIQDCQLGLGEGITLGSETSGGIENVTIKNSTLDETTIGFRIKSAQNRGGFIRNIKIDGLQMNNVRKAIQINSNWNTAYSYAEIPSDYQEEIPEHWGKLQAGVEGEAGLTRIENIEIKNIISKQGKATDSDALIITGDPNKCIKGLVLEDLSLEARRFGEVKGVDSLKILNCNFKIE